MLLKKVGFVDILNAWLPLALVITGLSGLIYGVTQYYIRTSANDPQIQIVQDTKIALENGTSPSSVIPTTKVDLSLSLSPFIIIYDDNGHITATNAVLNNQTPELPNGVFEYVKNNGEDRLTWEPKPGVREATVVISYKGSTSGFLLVGRSLKEVERREDELLQKVAIGYFLILSGSFILTLVLKKTGSKLSN